MANVRLTNQLREQILASVRAGGYPQVAAQAWGVPVRVFEEWMRRGQGPKARQPYAGFAKEVLQAHGQARLKAEVEAFGKDPKVWLEHGPGRETPGQPGWSTAVKPAETLAEPMNVWLQTEIVELFQTLLKILTPFPEARAHAARVLPMAAPSPPVLRGRGSG